MAKTKTSEKQKVKQKGAPDNGVSIDVRGVSKNFGPRRAVNSLSFEVRMGEVVGFLGPNGSGKTTTMRMLTSYYTPDTGRIRIGGVDTQEQDMVTRNSIGYLPESNPLYGDLLVREYLNFVGELRGMSAAELRENTTIAVEEAGLEEVYYRPINQLSKGYRQRVGLAQAILHRPSILILDEPTEGLDPNQRLTIRELIRDLGQERTVMLSTHVMQEVEATCERVLVIRRGQLVADSPVDELLKYGEGMRVVHIEVEGNEIESGMKTIRGVSGISRQEPIDGRKCYSLTLSGDSDPRPEIFNLAKKRGWVLWELHEERPRLEDVFHALTSEEEGA